MVTRFLPYVLSLMIDDEIQQFNAKLKVDYISTQEAVKEYMIAYSRERSIATAILIAYLQIVSVTLAYLFG